MSNINISDKLINKKPTITVDTEHTYEVNNFKETAFLIDEIVKDEKIPSIGESNDKYEKVIETALGKEALKYLKTKNLSLQGWNVVMEAIMAQIQGISLEEIQKEEKKALKTPR